jgi:hypothetical protein
VEKQFERLTAWILEQQEGMAALLGKFQRPHGPSAVKFVPQAIFVGEASEDSRRGTLQRGKDDQNRSRPATQINASPAAERTLGVLQEDLEVADSANVECKG